MSEFNAEFWNEIKSKYLKSYKKFTKYISILKDIEVECYYLEEIICYCDIENFFYQKAGLCLNFLMQGPINENETYENYIKYKLEAVKKAFEILNNQLENNK
jgi:hypothetical protein